jgi:hypothetical protein
MSLVPGPPERPPKRYGAHPLPLLAAFGRHRLPFVFTTFGRHSLQRVHYLQDLRATTSSLYHVYHTCILYCIFLAYESSTYYPYLFIYLFMYLFIYSSIYQFINLSIYLFIYLSIHLFFYLSMYLCIYLYNYLVINLFIHVFIHLLIYVFVYLLPIAYLTYGLKLIVCLCAAVCYIFATHR